VAEQRRPKLKAATQPTSAKAALKAAQTWLKMQCPALYSEMFAQQMSSMQQRKERFKLLYLRRYFVVLALQLCH
jgi:uncharacterized membrane protein YeiB